MRVIRALVVAGSCAFSVVGCDSFRGAQQPIESPATLVAMATQPKYSADAAITAFYSSDPTARDGLSPEEYRDKVVSLRLMAIEARYQAFVQELRGARTGVGLGADIVTLILGGLGTIIADTTTKTVLAAGTATIAGSRVSFDKNLFYDQTLPAIVAQMDAERAKQILVIRSGLAKSASLYPLPDAFMDLVELERLGSIETAIKGITESATAQAADAQANLKRFTLTRAAGDQKYMLSSTGQALTVTLTKAVEGLSDERAIGLANNPPVANETMDRIAAGMIATAGGRLSAAQAKAILKMRVNNALNEAELKAWAKAFQ